MDTGSHARKPWLRYARDLRRQTICDESMVLPLIDPPSHDATCSVLWVWVKLMVPRSYTPQRCRIDPNPCAKEFKSQSSRNISGTKLAIGPLALTGNSANQQWTFWQLLVFCILIPIMSTAVWIEVDVCFNRSPSTECPSQSSEALPVGGHGHGGGFPADDSPRLFLLGPACPWNFPSKLYEPIWQCVLEVGASI